jgi:hypothetical protein
MLSGRFWIYEWPVPASTRGGSTGPFRPLLAGFENRRGLFSFHGGERHNANISPVPIRDCKGPMLKAALVPMAPLQHISRYHSAVLPRLFISGEYIALRIGNRPSPAHYDIEKIPRHSHRISCENNPRNQSGYITHNEREQSGPLEHCVI